MAQYTILSTKKIAPTLKEEMVQRGIDVLEEEFITIKPILNQIKQVEIKPWIEHPVEIAVVFTSQHAAATVNKYLRPFDTYIIPGNWRVFCLSGATKESAQQHILAEQLIDTAPNATELAAKIIAHGQFKQVVFFCGNQRREELPRLLKEAGIEVVEIVVYETIATPVLATNNLDAVLFFSPSAVKSFFSVNTLKKDTPCFAIGATTAAAIGEYTDNKVITSDTPSPETMLASVLFYLQNIDLYK
ncbi:uroporphyrinogen-III synthase [Pseudoflavitalea sp. X16]|uniref:uroporphyrinogen-III synthase n=1 Tax=Paraflavitalea devenefica TaxID=2716334 RepID=UPI00141DB99B|nr:uroporphyrinogen-III synthase [Paraflavitalea devenefica]NII24065.1 uroporphyrinogen-III synthase [Paraflavitalea devenefica]